MEPAVLGLLGVLILAIIVASNTIYQKLGSIEKSQDVINGQFLEIGQRVKAVEEDNKKLHNEIGDILVEFSHSVTTLTTLCDRVITGKQ